MLKVSLRDCVTHLKTDKAENLIDNVKLDLETVIRTVGFEDATTLLRPIYYSLPEQQRLVMARNLRLYAIYCAKECLPLIDPNLLEDRTNALLVTERAALGIEPPEGFTFHKPKFGDSTEEWALHAIDLSTVADVFESISSMAYAAGCKAKTSTQDPDAWEIVQRPQVAAYGELFICTLHNHAPWQKIRAATIVKSDDTLTAKVVGVAGYTTDHPLLNISGKEYKDGEKLMTRVTPMGQAF